MDKELVGATPPHHVGVFISRNPLSAFAPIGDPPVPVYEIHAVVQVVEQFTAEFFIGDDHRVFLEGLEKVMIYRRGAET